MILGILTPIVVGIILIMIEPKKAKEFLKVTVICAVVFGILGTVASMVVIIPAGTVGVHDLFGSVAPSELPSGLQFKNPFAHIEMMNIKTLEIKETSEVPSKEGLIVILETSILFKISPIKANEIYKKIGIQYVYVVIKPQLRSIIREVTSKFNAKALYTTGRLNITRDIFNALEPDLQERGIILEKVLLRDLGLPQTLTDAIEQKLTAEQEIEQKEFDVAKEFQEAERKRIEAQGIADANNIIATSLTENYLRWYWIENLDKHTSVIYVPVGDGGMPIFKNVDITQ